MHAQTFGGIGTRAEGMGGAFVAVADDASAVYWNPAGIATGATFDFQVSGRQSSTVFVGVGPAGPGRQLLPDASGDRFTYSFSLP